MLAEAPSPVGPRSQAITGNGSVGAALRVLDLIEAVTREPTQGIGKPEPLKHLGAGLWSRRVTQEHRLVYLVTGNRIDFLQCRYHY